MRGRSPSALRPRSCRGRSPAGVTLGQNQDGRTARGRQRPVSARAERRASGGRARRSATSWRACRFRRAYADGYVTFGADAGERRLAGRVACRRGIGDTDRQPAFCQYRSTIDAGQLNWRRTVSRGFRSPPPATSASPAPVSGRRTAAAYLARGPAPSRPNASITAQRREPSRSPTG